MTKRTIAIVTGSRADYGLLRWIMEEVRSAAELELMVIATGMHYAADLGETYRIIERDGFSISARVDMLLVGDSKESMTRSVGVGVMGFCDAFSRLRPDLVLVLGDRFEIFAAATAATLLGIPIAHVHGGETTEGAIDESLRHAITKMAHLHFAAAAPYAKRIVQMGENPAFDHTVGAPGIEGVRRTPLLNRDELERALNVELSVPLFAVTYHPVTLGDEGPERPIDELLRALDRFPAATIIATRANADPAGRSINSLLAEYCSGRRNAHLFSSLGQQLYFSVLSHADAVIGNSSSGLIEAPFLGTPTVNLGDRQRGRLRATTVVDCEEVEIAIVRAIAKALDPAFRAEVARTGSPYGDGRTAARIAQVLGEV